MKKITIRLHKSAIFDYIDAATFKRVDAQLDGNSDRSQNAMSSDAEDVSDHFLMAEYCDRRDARLRSKLKFCLIEPEIEEGKELVFDNTGDCHEDYLYFLNVEDDFSVNALKVVGRKMDEYIKRGAILDWYIGAGLDPNDTESAIGDIEDEIVSSLRGRPWGHRPMQPFGPASYDFYRKK